MFALLIPFLLLAVPAAAAEQAPPTEVQFEGETYQLLVGDKLRAALVGHEFSCVGVPVSTAGCWEDFRADGHSYVHSGDREPHIHGTYEIMWDHVCTMTYGPTCSALAKSKDNLYLELYLKNGVWLPLYRVEISKSRWR
jgi:hypothetical protein